MKRSAFVFASLLLATSSVWADSNGTFYELGSKNKTPIFRSEHRITPEGDMDRSVSTYFDPNGGELYQERAQLKGSEIVKVEIDQKQMGQSALIEVKGNLISFSKTVDGKTKTETEKKGETFVMSANFQRFVKDKWSDLLAGKDVEFRFGSWDRQETVGFKIFKIGEGEVRGQKTLKLKMKPSSFVIAAIVDPLIFDFAMDGSGLLSMSGRVPVKKKSGEKWKDLDADGEYLKVEAK